MKANTVTLQINAASLRAPTDVLKRLLKLPNTSGYSVARLSIFVANKYRLPGAPNIHLVDLRPTFAMQLLIERLQALNVPITVKWGRNLGHTPSMVTKEILSVVQPGERLATSELRSRLRQVGCQSTRSSIQRALVRLSREMQIRREVRIGGNGGSQSILEFRNGIAS